MTAHLPHKVLHLVGLQPPDELYVAVPLVQAVILFQQLLHPVLPNAAKPPSNGVIYHLQGHGLGGRQQGDVPRLPAGVRRRLGDLLQDHRVILVKIRHALTE